MIKLSIATINLANFGEWCDDDRIGNFIHSIVHDMKQPDIIAVQEIGGSLADENDYVAANVAHSIVERLWQEYGCQYHYVDIKPLAESSGGAKNLNIRCGFFYINNMKLISVESIGLSHAAFLGDDELNFVPSRFPLLAEFKFNDQQFSVINCHLKSMSLKGQLKKEVKKQRNLQTKAIVEYVQDRELMSDPLFILGDMNDTFNRKTLQSFVELGLLSAHTTLKYHVYSYKHQRKSILLDYILYNEKVTFHSSEIIHINTDRSSSKSYSDHDPVLMSFTL